MPIAMPSGRRLYKFGLYEADLDQGILTRQGTPVKLQEQPFRILALLLEARGEVLAREELRKSIWPEGTFVEFDGSMNTALMKLRAALNDNADNPVFIETVPRRGYRFIAPVELAPVETPTVVTAIRIESDEKELDDLEFPTDAAAEGSLHRKQLRAGGVTLGWWQVAAILVAVMALVIYVMWPKPEARVIAVRQLTHSGQLDPWGKLVTDGSRIYFVVRDVTGWNLMQTSVEGGGIQRTPTPFDNTRIFDLSPDHTQFLIGQLTHSGEETALWLWPVQGGAPHRVGDVTAQEAVWSPKGDMIAYIQGESIQITDLEGGHSREVARFHPAPRSLVWSPDGRRLRFTQPDLSEGTDSMWEIGWDPLPCVLFCPRDNAVPMRAAERGSLAGNISHFPLEWICEQVWQWIRRRISG